MLTLEGYPRLNALPPAGASPAQGLGRVNLPSNLETLTFGQKFRGSLERPPSNWPRLSVVFSLFTKRLLDLLSRWGLFFFSHFSMGKSTRTGESTEICFLKLIYKPRFAYYNRYTHTHIYIYIINYIYIYRPISTLFYRVKVRIACA